MTYPLKLSVKSEAAPLSVIAAAWALSGYFYANFPERVPSHWNFAGEVDGWSSAALGAFMLPAVITAMYLFFLASPLLDPKRERYAEFAKPFHVFKASIVAILGAVYASAGFAGLGYDVPVGIVVPIGVGLLFIVLGNYFGKVKTNWLMGIRTPWTLSSEEVWNKTHRLGGKMFILSGLLIALDGFLPAAARLPVFIGAVVLAAVVPVAYSYALYRRTAR